MTFAFAITLKIPDNAAYTTLTTLQRLGISVARVERSDVLLIEDEGPSVHVLRRIECDERIFNPNKHRAIDLGIAQPRPGEIWIGERGAGKDRFVAWRLFGPSGAPLERALLERAAQSLLCNPAIETARYEDR